MTAHFAVYLLLLAAPSGSTQPAAIAPGDIRCSGCALTGQKAGPIRFDESQIEFVANPVLAFDEGRTFRTNVLARVLNAAPLILEILDSRHQMLDRHLEVVAEDPDNGRDPATCRGPERISTVDLASRPVVSTLRLNDIVTGAIMMRRDERVPHAVRAGTPVLTNVRKLSARTRFFHATGIPPHCVNRSGRLIVRDGPEQGETTVVYNDGSIYHRNAAHVTFIRERLSAAELSALMRAFRVTNFNAIATTFPESGSGEERSLTLIGSRYQRVLIEDGGRRLAPLLTRLDAIAARSMSRATYVLKRGSAIPLNVRPWPYPAIDPASSELWPRTVKTRLRDVPPEGLTISREEYDRHKAVYLPLLKQRVLGVNYIEDGVLYGQVRICQIEAGAGETCDHPGRRPGDRSRSLSQAQAPGATTTAADSHLAMSAPM